MASVALVIDSTAYLPQEMVKRYGIHEIPLYVRFGEEVYRDNVDMSPTDFYARLRTTPVMPATSQPSAGDFLALYRRLLEAGASEILSVHISSNLSGTISSALMARDELPGVPIHIVDSLSTSMGLGFMALEAAKALEAGRPAAEVAGLLEQRREQTRITFVVDTLEFLHRGGRIGGAAAFLGSMLNVKPLLSLREGRIEPLERVRTKKKAVQRMLDIMATDLGQQPARAAVIHAAVPQEAHVFAEEVAARIDCQEMVVAEVSPVIGTHTGPGTVGLVIYPAEG